MKRDNPKSTALLEIGEIDYHQETPWPSYVGKYQFEESDIDDLVTLVTSNELNTAPPSSTKVWAPLHSWRALGQLKATKAVEPILQFFDRFGEDDFASIELPEVFGMIGDPAIEPLGNHLQKSANNEFSHELAISGLATIAAQQNDSRARILEVFRNYMQPPKRGSQDLYGFLIEDLVDLEAVELIEEIRYLFKLDCVDLSCCGDLESVEIDLGLRQTRDTPPPYLYELEAASTHIREAPKVGRNDPCSYNSGKKFKKCCCSNK